MKQFILLIGTVIFATSSFADSANLTKSLETALKQPATTHAKLDPNDINIVYGGADISRNPTIVTHATA